MFELYLFVYSAMRLLLSLGEYSLLIGLLFLVCAFRSTTIPR
jgi:hypothetical protein